MAVAPKPIPQTTHEVHEFSSTRKWIIAFSVMLGTVLEVLDSSIVNVSLPHMQGSFSASVDEIAWVVTSLPGRGGNHDPDDRVDRRALRPQALLRRGNRYVRRVVRAVRRGAIAEPDCVCSA